MTFETNGLVELTCASTSSIPAQELAQLRAMLLESFGPSYDELSWLNCQGGLHFRMYYRGTLASHLSIVRRPIAIDSSPLKALYVESVATLPRFRHLGLAKSLVSAASAVIRREYDIGVLATGLVSFYEPLGWRVWTGPTLVHEGGGTRAARPRGEVMVLIPPTTEVNVSDKIATNWRRGDIW
jgi:aminoglycoside 2'-N-acetyltransferase I